MSTLRPYPIKLGLAFIVAAKELARDGCELGVKDCPWLIGTLIKPMGFINQQDLGIWNHLGVVVNWLLGACKMLGACKLHL